jgi:hypothetical protein
MVIKLERQLKRKDNSKPRQNSGSFLSWRPNYKKDGILFLKENQTT